MGLFNRSQPLAIWRVGSAVPGEWVREVVRDALRNTAYALAGLAVSLFGFAVVAPDSLHVFTYFAGAGEFTLAVVWWIYAGYRSSRVEGLAGIDRVRDFMNARRLATTYTIVGLVASVELLCVALLAPTGGSPTRYLRLLGLRVSLSGPQLGTAGLVGFYLVLGGGLLLGAVSHRRTHVDYSLAHYFKICEKLAEKPCTLDDLEQAGLSREAADRWLAEAESGGFVVRETPGRVTTAGQHAEHWALTQKGAAGLLHDGFPGPVQTAVRDRPASRRRNTMRRSTPT